MVHSCCATLHQHVHCNLLLCRLEGSGQDEQRFWQSRWSYYGTRCWSFRQMETHCGCSLQTITAVRSSLLHTVYRRTHNLILQPAITVSEFTAHVAAAPSAWVGAAGGSPLRDQGLAPLVNIQPDRSAPSRCDMSGLKNNSTC